jgi:hypothetical protein
MVGQTRQRLRPGRSVEAFAEEFTAWVGLPSYQTERDPLYRIDRETAAFFDAIAWQV